MKELPFGQTPYDTFDAARLRKKFDRMFATLKVANRQLKSIRNILESAHPGQPFFSSEGWGAKDFEFMKQALERAKKIHKRSKRKEILLAVYALLQGILSAYNVSFKIMEGSNALVLQAQLRSHLLPKDHDRENLYRNFFRYAIDFLFEDREVSIRPAWTVCPTCNAVSANAYFDKPRKLIPGSVHKDVSRIHPDCDGVLRAYTWKDLNRPDLEQQPSTKETK